MKDRSVGPKTPLWYKMLIKYKLNKPTTCCNKVYKIVCSNVEQDVQKYIRIAKHDKCKVHK